MHETLAQLLAAIGIFAAVGDGTAIDLGGSAFAYASGPTSAVIVNIATLQGPADQTSLIGFHGWAELTMDGPESDIEEWNGSSFVSVQSSLTSIGAYELKQLIAVMGTPPIWYSKYGPQMPEGDLERAQSLV